MKVIVTGGAGYIGSIATEVLLNAGHRVLVVDNLSKGHRSAVPKGVDFERVDLRDKDALAKVISYFRPEAVMHFASYTLVGESMEQPLMYLGDNVRCALNLLEAMLEFGVKKFILSSTANLFGIPEQVPIPEDAPINPGSPYGESKFYIERILHWLSVTKGLRYAALRYFNAAGATEERGEDHRPETHLIPVVLSVALGKREYVTVFGNDYPTKDGTCVRDYIHVVDLAEAHVLALNALEKGNCVYNLGNGMGFTVMEVIEVARQVTGRPIPVKIGARRPGDPAILVASSERIKRELGWTPRYPDLRSIIESAWNWHRRFPNGYPD